jgi:hypothetical protein
MAMTNLFKQEEQKPFAYPSIEMRKSSRSYFKWIAVIILVVVLFIVLLIKY